MYGFTIIDFLRFVMQLGLAFAGASAMWGLYYAWQDKLKLAELLYRTVLAGVAIFFVGFAGLVAFFPELIHAHEGIALVPELTEVSSGIQLTLPLLISILLVSPLGCFAKKRGQMLAFFGVMFGILALAIMFQIYNAGSVHRQQFFSIHTIHSVFTLGTVMTVDYLYVMTSITPKLKLSLYPHFAKMSTIIWMGLGMDFLSVYPIFDEAFRASPKFYLAQTVVAIIVINGALLSGKMTKALEDSIKGGKVRSLSPKVAKIASVSGSVSIVSWLTITFVDFFPNISIPYPYLLVIYLCAIVVAGVSESLLMKRLFHA